MEAVFLGGSRRIARLDERIRTKLDQLVARGLWMLVGDANGADRAIQEHLASRGYERVVVYSVAGMLRNNVGHWEVRSVEAPKGARGCNLYSAKDREMAKDASYGFMIWDGKSRGTLENVRNLLAYGKPVAVHLEPLNRFVSLRSTEELHKLGVVSSKNSRDRHDISLVDLADTARQTSASYGGRPSRAARPQPKRRRSASARNRS